MGVVMQRILSMNGRGNYRRGLTVSSMSRYQRVRKSSGAPGRLYNGLLGWSTNVGARWNRLRTARGSRLSIRCSGWSNSGLSGR